MAQTAAQIVATACAIAKAPGFLVQGGQALNEVLDDICQTYDFDIARGVTNFNFNPGLVSTVPPFISGGGGPYALPSDYLRADYGDVFFMDIGVPHTVASIDLYQFDKMVQQAGLQSYPTLYATDLSLQNTPNPVIYFYSPPQSNYPVTIRYRRQMPSITTPETSSVVPWFPSTAYLVTATAGKLMRITDDDRAEAFLGNTRSQSGEPIGAMAIMQRILAMANDNSGRAKTVKLDPRRFGPDRNMLPATKSVWI